jgi:hypothetical protein
MVDLFPSDVVPLLPFVPFAILGLVNLIKSLGLSGSALTLSSFVIGLVFGLALYLLPAGVVRIIVVSVLFGLSASGLYDLGKLISGRVL